MKNQYIGDIGDYGKYGLLRFLRASGTDIGVNWYLTPNDERSDGNHTEYLFDKRMRDYDPEVYNAMQDLAFREDKSVQMVEQNAILHGIRFYDVPIGLSCLYGCDRAGERTQWHDGAMQALRDAALVFADPDNGLSTKQRPTKKDAQKYVLPSEIAAYYLRGQQVMYYHHRSRKNAEAWLEEKRQIKEALPDARLLALSFHRWTARSYIFVIHEEQYTFYSQVAEEFIRSKWGSHRVDGKVPFTIEPI